MVLNYYKLAEQPFGVTPDPRYLYLSPTHREALASALYGITVGRGFTALIAKPGMGKTTILFHLLQKLQGSARTVFVFQTQSSPRDLLRSLLVDLGIDDDGGDMVQMQAKMNQALLQHSTSGKRFVVVIDEAQNLDESVLEVVRMLSNFETPREKLMQIVLAGQPQLAKRLASPSMEQLRQRVSIVARLMPLDAAETRAYIEHRLSVAGRESTVPLFTDRAFAMIAKYSGGIPRNINNLCFNAMSLGCVRKQETIDRDVIKEVLTDLDLTPLFEDAPVAGMKPISTPVTVPALPYASSSTARAWNGWPLKVGAAAAAIALGAVAWPTIRSHMTTRASNDVKPAAAVATPAVVPASVAPVTTPVPTPVAIPTETAAQPTQSLPQTEAEVRNEAHPVTTSPVSLMESSTKNVSSESARAPRELPNQAFRTISIVRNETLFGISMENYGRYDEQIVSVIRQMNPSLTDPDHIKAGQKLRIPVVDKNSNLANPAAQTAEVNKQ
jgi:general secretion pathway protein A